MLEIDIWSNSASTKSVSVYPATNNSKPLKNSRLPMFGLKIGIFLTSVEV